MLERAYCIIGFDTQLPMHRYNLKTSECFKHYTSIRTSQTSFPYNNFAHTQRCSGPLRRPFIEQSIFRVCFGGRLAHGRRKSLASLPTERLEARCLLLLWPAIHKKAAAYIRRQQQHNTSEQKHANEYPR